MKLQPSRDSDGGRDGWHGCSHKSKGPLSGAKAHVAGVFSIDPTHVSSLPGQASIQQSVVKLLLPCTVCVTWQGL